MRSTPRLRTLLTSEPKRKLLNQGLRLLRACPGGCREIGVEGCAKGPSTTADS